MADETCWPTRNVAEYAYCSRLFYYMTVEGLFLPSVDTEEGNHVHRRVDSASKTGPQVQDPDHSADRPKVVRSLVLTSINLNLTATLDLAEIDGQVAVPIEYRKGRPKRQVMAPPPDDPREAAEPPLSHPEAWPTDRVQVGLQALLLEESNFFVPHAVLYYAAEKLRLTIPVDDALRSEAKAVLGAAKRCAEGPRPMPLVNDSRCVRCSLQPICLPDEVNQQRLQDVKPRQIWPPRDEGIHLVTQKDGVRIGVRGASLHITDKDGVPVKDVPLANVESLALLGSVQLSTQAVQVLADRSVPVAFLSGAGRLIAMIDPMDSVSAEIRRAQARRFDDPQACLALARAVICAKITNQRTLLQRNHSTLPSNVPAELAAEAAKAAKSESIEEVRGHEGQAAAIYFEHFAGMFKGQLALEFDTHGRQRRPPPDPINSCISMGYSLLTHECVAGLRQARLEPSIGAFHVSRPGRPALALDLMEPFRPLIADSVAIAAFNRSELSEGHFLRTAAGCVLTDAGRRAFFNAWGRRMDTEITHPVFGYRLSYRRMLVLHARMIAAWLVGEVPSLAFLTTR
jgi:CRISPR-associated endonuclease Cas1/CRISPR-associated protein Cas4